MEDNLNGFNIYIGSRFNRHFSLEFGYFRNQEESKNIANGEMVGRNTVATANFKTRVKVQGITLDSLVYLPLGESEKFELIGTAGLAYSKAEIDWMSSPSTGSVDSSESEIGFRMGAGAQISFTDHINLRGMVRYQKVDFDDQIDNAWTYSLGLNYSF